MERVNLDYLSGLNPNDYRDVNPVANFIQNYLKTTPQNGDFYENIDDNLGKALVSDSQLGLSSVVNSLSVKLDVASTVDIPFPFSTTVSVNSPNQIDADLYFGRNIPGDGEVSQKQFQTFVDTVIAPLFPGLTVFDANGEVRDASGNINKEQTKIVKLVLDQTPENTAAIDNVLNTYHQEFQGAVALQNLYTTKASADPTANLIDSTSTPKLIQADLFFGRNIPGDGAVSQQQFQAFLDNTVAPRFSGLTVFDTNGEARDASGNINKEESKDVRLIIDNTPENAAAISDVLQTYQQQFGGSGVFQEINQNIKAGFSADDNLIDSTSDSKQVEADLFFGRNIPGSIGQVSEQQFQAFVDDVIGPRFPGSTVFNANGEVRDANGNINQEESKVVAVFLDNTLENDAAINDVLKTYQQQFNGAGFLQVINQGIEASSGASPPVVFPDQNSLIGAQSV